MINSIDWTHAYDMTTARSFRKPPRIDVLGSNAIGNKSECVAAERVAGIPCFDMLISETVVSNSLAAPTRARLESLISSSSPPFRIHVTTSPRRRRRSAREGDPIPSHPIPLPHSRAPTMKLHSRLRILPSPDQQHQVEWRIRTPTRM
jgi:hypothetical protein